MNLSGMGAAGEHLQGILAGLQGPEGIRFSYIENDGFCIKNGGFCIKNGVFCIKMVDFVLKMMDFLFKMMDFALKMVDFALKMMNFGRRRHTTSWRRSIGAFILHFIILYSHLIFCDFIYYFVPFFFRGIS